MLDPESPPLRIKGRSLLPIVQGGMGVGVSAHRLAGTVASHGAMGTIASVDLRRLHPDLMRETEHTRDKEKINAANLVALDRETRAAVAIARGRGMIAVNVMRAVSPCRAWRFPWTTPVAISANWLSVPTSIAPGTAPCVSCQR